MTSITTRRKSDQGTAWPPNTPGAREAEDDIQQQTPHRRTVRENKYVVAPKQHRVVHNDTLHQPQNTNSLSGTRDNTAHMFFEGDPTVNLYAKNIEVGTSTNGNPRQDKSPWGGFRVLDLLTTKALVLLIFSIMHHS